MTYSLFNLRSRFEDGLIGKLLAKGKFRCPAVKSAAMNLHVSHDKLERKRLDKKDHRGIK